MNLDIRFSKTKRGLILKFLCFKNGLRLFKATRRMNTEYYTNRSNFDFIFSYKYCKKKLVGCVHSYISFRIYWW